MTTNQHNTTHITDPQDPRFGLAAVIDVLQPLLGEAEQFTDNPTPCPEFTVKELLEHLVLVLQQTTAIGNGEHWADTVENVIDSGWADEFRAATATTMAAWEDTPKLENVYEVPWGMVPGGPLLFSYTAELAVHGWDLATAIGSEFHIDDSFLGGALFATKMIPAEGRSADEVPFGEVVDAASDATVLEQIIAWQGRDVHAQNN